MGFLVSGIVHAIIGFLAINIAVRGAGEADQSGAFAQIAGTPGGLAMLWVVTIGLAALGLWLILGAFLIRSADPKRRVAHFLEECGKGLAYLLLAGAALTFARGGSQDSSTTTRDVSAQLLAVPGGLFALALLGIGVCVIGVYFIVKGVRRRFKRDITLPGGAGGAAVVILGVFGYVAKGIALFIVGVLFVAAALTIDPNKATGLDGALKTLAGLPYGQAMLVIVGAGLIAYGLYSCVRARLAHM